jgi:hypothetical protein
VPRPRPLPEDARVRPGIAIARKVYLAADRTRTALAASRASKPTFSSLVEEALVEYISQRYPSLYAQAVEDAKKALGSSEVELLEKASRANGGSHKRAAKKKRRAPPDGARGA